MSCFPSGWVHHKLCSYAGHGIGGWSVLFFAPLILEAHIGWQFCRGLSTQQERACSVRYCTTMWSLQSVYHGIFRNCCIVGPFLPALFFFLVSFFCHVGLCNRRFSNLSDGLCEGFHSLRRGCGLCLWLGKALESGDQHWHHFFVLLNEGKCFWVKFFCRIRWCVDDVGGGWVSPLWQASTMSALMVLLLGRQPVMIG